MLSKLTIWNIREESCPFYDETGVVALFTPDPYIEKLILQRRKKRTGGGAVLLLGDEVTIEWLENNLDTLSLFGGDEHYLILDAQKMIPSVNSALLEGRFDLSDKKILLCFSSKNDFFKKISKDSQWACYDIEAPPFWKDGELLTYICEENRVRLSVEAHQFILQAVPGTIGDFSTLAGQLYLNFAEKEEIARSDVESILSAYKVDQFRLAALLSQKKRVEFLKELLSLPLGFEEMEELFRMIQFHFLKIIDPSYMRQKKKLSKYDREIEQYSRMWKPEELERVLLYFKDLELAARSRDLSIKNRLREALLANLIRV